MLSKTLQVSHDDLSGVVGMSEEGRMFICTATAKYGNTKMAQVALGDLELIWSHLNWGKSWAMSELSCEQAKLWASYEQAKLWASQAVSKPSCEQAEL